MKTFFNVLYRRILYKIPLKLLLVILSVVALFFAYTKGESIDGAIGNWTQMFAGQTITFGSTLGDFVCITSQASACNDMTVSLGDSTNRGNPYSKLLCAFNVAGEYAVVVNNNTSNNCPFYFMRGYKSDFSSIMTSLQCQTEYNLIPISSVDSNYCTTNNLCPSCPVCPVGSGSISNLYINDILHVGSPFINITIPEEISRDYEYTQGGSNMNIDIEGYNVDYEYVDSVINLQNYKPDSSDLSGIVSGVLPLFVPGLVIILFLYFVFKFIKKIF